MAHRFFSYFILAVILNASVNVSDDLYCNWYSPNSNEDAGATYNKIDHVLEYVVEICFGVQNFFPEHRIPQNAHNALHKIFLFDITGHDLALESPGTLTGLSEKGFLFFPAFINATSAETDSPPPKSMLSF